MWAQSADVSGLIRDSSGAFVPGATVVLLHLDSGMRRQAASDVQGQYSIAGTRAGTYRVSVRKSGFQPAARQGIELLPGDHARIDFTLAVEGRRETIQVQGETPSEMRPSGSAAVTLERPAIEATPLNGRSLLPLLEALPGTVVTPAGSGEVGQFSVNGQRQNSNYVTVDGVSANFAVNDGLPGQAPSGSTPALTALGSMHSIAPVEALEAVEMETAPDVTAGRLPGANIAIRTRSGGESLHGSAFEYGRNEALDANNWFANSRSVPRAPLRVNDFGASAGGPLWRGRTYFFAAHESMRVNLPYTLRSAVPAEEARWSRSARVQELLKAYPAPNGPLLDGGFAEVTLPVARDSALDTSSLRLDHNFGSRARLFVRGYRAPSGSSGGGMSAFTQGHLSMSSNGLTVGLTQSVSSHLISDFRAGWTVATARYGLQPIGASGADLTRIIPAVGSADQTTYSIHVDGLEPVVQTNGNRHSQPQWNLLETVTWNSGRHEWKFGADSRWMLPTIQSKPWNLFASFASIDALSAGQAALITATNRLPVAVGAHNLSLFAQDSWKLHSRAQLSYGLRWEWNPPMTGRNGTTFWPVMGLEDPFRAEFAEKGSPLWDPKRGMFAPRAGAAVRIWKSLTVRAGAGLFHDLGYGVSLSSLASAPPNSISLSERGVPLDFLPPVLPSTPLVARLPYERGFGFAPGFQLPRVVQWHAGIEQPIGQLAIASASFVGADGIGLMRREWISRPNPDFLGIEVMSNAGFSRYRALQAQLRSRTGGTFSYRVSYTFANSTDNASKDSKLYQYGDDRLRALEIGPSTFDVRHAWHAMFSVDPKGKIVKGWGLDWVVRSRSALPLNVLTGYDPIQVNSTSYVLRPDVVAGEPFWMEDPGAPGGRILNRAAFRTPSINRQGTLGRNALRGFAFSQLDLSLRRTLQLGETRSLELRADAFNALNRANLGDPQSILRSPQFGESLNMLNSSLGTGGPANGLMPIFQIGGPRSLQLSVRLRF